MKKLHFIIIFLITVFLTSTYYLGYIFIYSSSRNDLIEQQLKIAQYQSQLVANILSDKIERGESKEEVVNNLQRALENSSSDPVFICMFDKNGKEITHPDRKKIGTKIMDDESRIKSFSNMDLEENFKTILTKYPSYGGLHKIDNKTKNNTEVIYLSRVKNTDWIIASHSNLAALENTLDGIKAKLILSFVLIWISSITLILVLINLLYHKYFNKITKERLPIQSQNIEEQNTQDDDLQGKDKNRVFSRFLAEQGVRLIPIEVDNIAFVYLENKVTYVVDFKGVKYTLNLSLEEVYQKLPQEQFFRISRQIILSLKSIQNIEKYGLTQLRVITDPVSEIPIVISKAKVSEFKSWVGKK